MENRAAAIGPADLAAASIDGVGVIDGEKYGYANDALAEIHGYDAPADIVGREWAQLYSVDERDLTASELLARVRRETEWRGSATGHGPGRATLPVELSMRATEQGIVCVVRERGGTDGVTWDPLHTDGQQEGGVSDPRRAVGISQNLLDALHDVIYVVDETDDVVAWNSRLNDRLGYTDAELAELSLADFLPEEYRALLGEDKHMVDFPDRTREMEVVTKDGEQIPHELRGVTYTDEATGERYRVGVARDITERRERERELERQRDELDTLNRINELLLAVARDLFESPMRGEIEQTVCARLADSDLYRFAWIGTPEVGSDRLVPVACAGVDEAYVDSITVTTGEGETGRGPGGRAFRTGEIQVSQDVATDPTFEPWREAALDRDVGSAAAVPLTYDGTTYGILAVYASRPLAFSQREQRGFEILGEAIGYAINATRTRQLLFAERVTELEFRVGDVEEFVVGAADRLGCRLSLEGCVSTGNGRWVLYCSLGGDNPERFVDAARDAPTVETVRTNERGAEWGVVLRARSSLFDTIAALGGQVTSGSVDDGRTSLVVELPQSTETSEFVEQVRSMHPGTELVAKRDGEPRPEESAPFDGDGHVDLTDRQRQVLEAAFRAGYFEWPRENSADDVAELLDISRPTLQAHLRKAEKELVSTFFARRR